MKRKMGFVDEGFSIPFSIDTRIVKKTSILL